MKKLLSILAVSAIPAMALAQFQLNPQIGLTYQSLSNIPSGYDARAMVGWQVGTDARIGNRLFVQPGVFLSRYVTAITQTGTSEMGSTNSVDIEDDLISTNLKLRAQLGYRIIDSYQFDLRVMLGPSFDVIMSVDDRDDKLGWNRGDFNAGVFNLEGGLGFDMGHFTVAPSVSLGLTRVFNDDPAVSQIDSKYISYGLTVGFNFGDDDKKD